MFRRWVVGVIEKLTSSATTTFPPARPDNMCVRWAYPVGVTWHSPRSSPSAASKPAETREIYEFQHNEMSFRIHTNHEFGGKLHCYWHNDLLEGVNVVSISHACLRPRNVDGTALVVG